MSRPSFTGRATRILDFDIENRPLNYFGMEFTGAEITAIGWQFLDQKKAHVVLLGLKGLRTMLEEFVEVELDAAYRDAFAPLIALIPKDDGMALPEMLEEFLKAYNKADMVTGHFIRGHDLPHLNAACVEMGLPPLSSKLSHDTKLDLMKFKGLSKSQENLGATLGLAHPKVSMNQAYWREANRLTPEGVARTKKRVIGDVRQHIELRDTLMRMGALRAPRMWYPGGSGGIAGYEA